MQDHCGQGVRYIHLTFQTYSQLNWLGLGLARVKHVMCAALLLALGSACDSSEANYEGARVPVRVMTRNLYLGADISSVLLAPNAESVPGLAGAFWTEVLRSDFPSRAGLLADEIVAASP